MKHPLLNVLLMVSATLLTACDEGDIVDATFTDPTETLAVKFEGEVSGLDAWTDGYDVVVAAFDDASDYSVVQKQLTASADGRSALTLSGIPTSATSIELCVTNRLRRRVVTFESIALPAAGGTPTDTLHLRLSAPLDVSMMASIQRYIFDDAACSCSLCHSGPNARAGLDLSEGRSAGSLVGVASSRVDGATRVVPGNAAESVLHQALAEGNPAGLRYDHGNLLTAVLRRLIDDWIDGGAKE